MSNIISEKDFKNKYFTKEELIDIAKNNNGICIEDINYTISYMPDINKFKIEYADHNLKSYIVDYFYIVDHFR